MKINKHDKFKVIEEIFFGGKRAIAENLSYKKAVNTAIACNKSCDVYTNYYVLPNNIESNLISDYDKRINIYLNK